jgi:hypothetical protein
VSTPLGCFLYGGVNASRAPFADLWHLEPGGSPQGASNPLGLQWRPCKCLPMCPMEHALGPGESAPSRSMLTSDRVAVGHDGPAFAITHDTQLVVRAQASCAMFAPRHCVQLEATLQAFGLQTACQ